MSTIRMVAVLGLLIAFDVGVAQSNEPAQSRPAPRVAYGDTPEFWETYALVVARKRHGCSESASDLA